MADVKWARDPREERAKKMRCIIRSKSSLRDIRSNAQLADKANMGRSTLSCKMHSGMWTCEDIKALDKVLRLSAEEIAELVRC